MINRGKHLVQRLLPAHVGRQAREPRRAEVRGFQRYRPVIGQAQPLDPEHRKAPADAEPARGVVVRADPLSGDQLRRGDQPVRRRLRGEAGQVQRPAHLRLGHVGARSLPADQPALGDQVEHRLPDRGAGGDELRSEITLGGQRLAGLKRLDDVEQVALDDVVLRLLVPLRGWAGHWRSPCSCWLRPRLVSRLVKHLESKWSSPSIRRVAA